MNFFLMYLYQGEKYLKFEFIIKIDLNIPSLRERVQDFSIYNT